jgi:hypothetical protein
MAAAKGVIPDTCAWIDYFSPKDGPLAKAVERAIDSGRARTCGVVLFELAQGFRSEKEGRTILGALEALDFLEMDRPTWLRAAGISAALRRRGVTIPMSDILIAAIALEHDLAILTADPHFAEVSGLTVFG